MKRKSKASKKQARKAAGKTKKPANREKSRPGPARAVKPKETKSPVPAKLGPPAQQRVIEKFDGSFRISIGKIEGGTVLGDLMVVFPRTREVLKKHGLNLDVEEAGDIYMSLEAFSALRGLKMEGLIQELEIASKELPPQAPAPAIVVAPAL